jgi:hypothetical protein
MKRQVITTQLPFQLSSDHALLRHAFSWLHVVDDMWRVHRVSREWRKAAEKAEANLTRLNVTTGNWVGCASSMRWTRRLQELGLRFQFDCTAEDEAILALWLQSMSQLRNLELYQTFDRSAKVHMVSYVRPLQRMSIHVGSLNMDVLKTHSATLTHLYLMGSCKLVRGKAVDPVEMVFPFLTTFVSRGMQPVFPWFYSPTPWNVFPALSTLRLSMSSLQEAEANRMRSWLERADCCLLLLDMFVGVQHLIINNQDGGLHLVQRDSQVGPLEKVVPWRTKVWKTGVVLGTGQICRDWSALQMEPTCSLTLSVGQFGDKWKESLGSATQTNVRLLHVALDTRQDDALAESDWQWIHAHFPKLQRVALYVSSYQVVHIWGRHVRVPFDLMGLSEIPATDTQINHLFLSNKHLCSITMRIPCADATSITRYCREGVALEDLHCHRGFLGSQTQKNVVWCAKAV